MKYLSVREFRNTMGAVWEILRLEGELVLTNNGKPAAILMSIDDGDVERTLRNIRRARLLHLLNEARKEASERGFMSDDEILEEIRLARSEYKEKHGDYL